MLYYLLHSLISSMFVGTRGDCSCLSFSFMCQFSGVHKDIVLASLFCFPIDIRRHTSRFCLSFFSDWVYLCSMAFSSDCSLLEHVTGVSALLQRFGWDDQSCYFLVLASYHCTVSTLSRRWWSLFLTYTWNCSCLVFLLNFGLAYLPFLVNNGSDKPSKCWLSIYVVGRTW